MEKIFDRKSVREISDRVQSVLHELGEELGIELTVDGGNFTPASFKLNLVGHLKSEDGSIVATDAMHSLADTAAKSVGLTVAGHLVGSLWKIKGKVYTVVEYKTKRPKYPLSLIVEGKAVKSPVGFLRQGKQLIPPTEEEFYKWLSIDPDEDSVREEDVEIVDNVQEYFEEAYTGDLRDTFLDKASEFTEKGINRIGANKIYDKYQRFGLAEATLFMADMLKMPKYKKTKK